MRGSAIILSGICLLFISLIFLYQRRMLFPIHYAPQVPEEPRTPPNTTRLWIESDTARVEAWLIPGRGVTVVNPGPIVVFTHGNAEVIDIAAPMLTPYLRAGVSIALLEYRGYGRSSGGPSEDGLIADGLALVEQLRARPEVDADRIILHGRSLGGGVACGIAESFTPRAIILESTFTSVSDLAWDMWLPGFLVRDRFDNQRRLGQVKVPILIMHGEHDEVVPIKHAHRLKAASPNVELHTWPAGHNDLSFATVYWRTIQDFIRRVGVIQRSQ